VDTARLQKKRTTKEHVEKRSGVRNGDSRIQVQLQKDGGSGFKTEMDGEKWSVVCLSVRLSAG